MQNYKMKLRYFLQVLVVGLLILTSSCEGNSQEKIKEASKTELKAGKKSKSSDAKPKPRAVQEKSRIAQDINKKFPFDIPLRELNGDVVNSSEILKNNGKPIVLAFWLTTCPPCRAEMKNMKAHYEDWIKETGVRILFISTDFEKNAHKIAQMIEKNQYPYEVYHDFHREFREVLPGGLNGLPQTFIISSKGEILFHKRKYRSGDEFKLYEEMKKSVGLK